MIHRIWARFLICVLLAESLPLATMVAEGRPESEPDLVEAELVLSSQYDGEIYKEASEPWRLPESVGVEVQPADLEALQQESVLGSPESGQKSLRLVGDRPVPGIQRNLKSQSAQHSTREIEPPRAPGAVVAQAPDEYSGVTAKAEESAAPKQPRLSVRPQSLRFGLSADGVIPPEQALEISSDRRTGARFEVTGVPDWLSVEVTRGRAGLHAVGVRVAVRDRGVDGPVSGLLYVKNLDNPADEHRVAIELEEVTPGRFLRSYDSDGRLQRVVRPDGGILDYDYDARGQLIRVRRPDGSAVTWSYDLQGRRIAMTDERGTTVYRYNAQGDLDALYTPGFDPVRYDYDDNGRLRTLHLPGGQVVAYEHDDEERLLSVRSDLGTTRYDYDGAGRLSEQALPNGITTRYGYDVDGRLTGVTHLDTSGELLLGFSWSLDEQGRPVSVTRENSIGLESVELDQTDLAYDEEGRVASVADSSGRVTTYEYDSEGRRAQQIETVGSEVEVTDYTYDERGRLAQVGDETFVYDRVGNLAFRRSSDRELEYRWDPEGRLIGFSDGQNEVTYSLDGDGRRVGVTVDGRERSFLRDASGWIGDVLVEADGEGEIVRTHVHGHDLVAVQGSGGEGSYYLYDHPLRSSAALVSPSGAVEQVFESDPFGSPLTQQPTAVLPPFLFAGGVYDSLTGLIHWDGAEYDPRLGAFLPSVLDDDSGDGPARPPAPWANSVPAGVFAEALADTIHPDHSHSADPREEPTAGQASGQDPPAGSAEFLYDTIFQSNELPPASKRTKVKANALPSRYRLDPDEGSVYRRGTLPTKKGLSAPRLKLHPEYLPFAQTASGLLPASQTLEVESLDGQALSFTVSEDIPWLSVSSTGGSAPATLTVTVDPTGLTESGSPYVGDLVLTNSSEPEDVRKVRARLLVRTTGASVTLRSFDSNGNLRRVVKPDGGIIDYEVDPLGRVTRVRYPDIDPVAYAYDGSGNRISMTDHRGTTVYQYDRQNRLTGVFTPLGSDFIPVTYGYDKAGRLTSLSTPDGRTVFYQYDSDGRMTRVTDGADVTTYTYDPVSGLLASQTLPGGITTAYAYDSDGRLTGIVHYAPGGGLLLGFHYTLNALGQRTSVTKQTPEGSEPTTYGYDVLGRLDSVSYPDGRVVSYTYDASGNRLNMTTLQSGETTVVNYRYDEANRLLQAGEEIFQYDDNGNMVRRSSPARVSTYSYDSRNLLIQVETEGKIFACEYDGDGNRIAKVNNGLRTNFINDFGGYLTEVLVEANASWQILRSYSYGISRIGQTVGAVKSYHLLDGKNTAALSDGAGGLAEVYGYDGFGKPKGNSGENEFLFDGERFDAEASLIYLRARFYDPEVGRFLSRDPVPGAIELPRTLNAYVFAGNDPINRSDPTGLVDWERVGKASLELAGSTLTAAGGVALMTAGSAGLAGTGGASSPLAVPAIIGGKVVLDVGLIGVGASIGELVSAFSESEVVLPANGDPIGFLSFSAARGLGHDHQSAYEIADDFALAGDFLSFGSGSFSLATKGPNIVDAVSTGIDALDIGWELLDAFSEPQTPASFLYDGLSPALQSAPRHFADASSLDLGGVSLNKTADLLLSLQDITGATFDEATGQIVLLGQDNVALPPLEMSHVAVATQSVYGGQDPGVSIDPPIVNNQMSVRYEGQTEHTEFGEIMFEADRVLKILTLGKDNLTGQSVGSSVPGYKNLLQRRLASGCGGNPTSVRMWFQPKEVRLVPSTDGKSMVFDAVSMELLYESTIGNQVVSDPQAAAFASHFTQNYAAFAAEWPILQKLEQLGKIVAIVKWIKDNQIPIDLSFLDNFPIEFFSTATSTPVVQAQGTRQIGPVTCTVTLRGGVVFEMPNEYLPADPGAGAALSEALSERPSEETFLWTYEPTPAAAASMKASVGPVTAVAQSLTRSRRDGNVRFQEVDLSEPLTGGGELALLRTYNSFLDKSGPLGAGWSVLPAEVRFPVEKERFSFGSGNVVLDLYARIWVTERAEAREDAYDLLGIDSSNLPVYRRADVMHVLREQSDGTFQLTREDGSSATFRADGKPLSLVDRNGNAIDFIFDAQVVDRLLSLNAADGRTIDLSYDGQGRLSQVSGPGGRQVLYGYDAEGRLETVTDFAGRSRSYGYDSTGKLASATDAEGRSIFSAGYDDYDRTPSRRLGAAAQYGLEFDLESGESMATDPLGRISRQAFERRQLAAPSGIRNEVYRPRESEDALSNRVTMTWADDAFGPREVTDAQGTTTELAWDNRGHLTSVRDPLDGLTERFYDWRDRLIALRDAEGLATGFGYDDNNNPTTVYHDVELSFDVEGNLTSFSYDPSNVSSFGYDGSGNLAAASNPLGEQAEVENNSKGQPTLITSPAGVETTFGYDARARMTSTETGGRQTTYGYDAADQLMSVTTAAGTTSFVRDPQGRVTQLTDGLLQATQFSYDTDGRLTQVEDALSGVASYSYDVLGNLLSADLPNGTANAWEYDELGRPVAALTGLGPVAPALALTADSLDFGTIPVGTSRDRSLDLYNQGTAPLTVSAITVAPPFSVVFSGPVTVPPAGSLEVTVSFAPTDQAPASADLNISSDDPDSPLELVALSGAGARKVANLQASPDQEGIQLTWSQFDPGSQPFGHFNIYRSLTPILDDVGGLAPFDSSLTNANTTSFLDKLAAPGTSYYYAVTPVYANGDENTNVDPAGPVAYFTTFGPLDLETDLAATAQSENRPAIAYNSDADEYLVVYERSASASNADIYAQRVSSDGSLIGGPIALANSARDERRPRLAYNDNSNNYLVIWEYDQTTNGSNFDLQLRTVSATGSLGTLRTLGSSTSQDLAPEIAFGSTDREYLVAYETDGDGDGKIDLGMLRLNASGTLLGAIYLQMPGIPGFVNATEPQLAFNSGANEFMVVFERDLNGDGSNIELWETRFNPDLTLVVPQIFVLARNDIHDLNPFLAYDATHDEYLAVWERDATGTGTDLSVSSRKLTAAGGLGGIVFGLASDAANPRAVYNQNLDDFVIVWEEGGATPKIKARRVHFTITTLQTRASVDVTTGAASGYHRPDVGTSLVSNTFLTAWEEDAGSGNFDVRSRLLGTFAPALQVSPTTLAFNGGTTQQTLTITNSQPSGGPLQWTATPGAGTPWMTVQPTSGSTTSSVVLDVTVDRTGLAPGTYPSTVHVASNDVDIDVPVTLVVGNTPPDEPSAPSPADGSTNQASVSGGTDLTLSWQGGDADGDAVTWDVYLDTESTTVTSLDPAERIGQGLVLPSLQPAGLGFLTSYFWRVVATDSNGDSTVGPVWQFTTAAVPPPVLDPVIPDPTKETQPILSWQAVASATNFDLQVADNPGFSPILIDAIGLTATTFTPVSPLPEGTQYWRVRSVDAASQPGAFAAADSFVIDTTAAGVPTLVPVEPDPTNDAQPVLTWSEVPGAASYRVQVAESGGFSNPIVDATVSTLTYQPVTGLPEGSIEWRVASLDEAGNQSAFSGADPFTLDVTPPPAISGLTAQRQGANIDLGWQPLAGPPADFARFRIYRAEVPFTNVSGIPLLDESLTSAAAVSFLDETASLGVAYWYAITAMDAAGNENREVTTANILANEPPDEPVLVGPEIGAQVLPTETMTVPLAWSGSDPENDPLRFEVYLSTDITQVEGTPSITARIAEDLETPSFEALGLTYQNIYYWRVVALDLEVDGTVRSATFGPLWSFEVPAIPAPVLTPLAPDPTNQLRPTFAWQSVPGAASYQIEISTDSAFGSTEVTDEPTETSFTPSVDLPEGSLYWRIRAIDAQDLPGEYSVVDDFVLDATAPAVPTLVPVSPDPTSNRRPSLDWGALVDASIYHVQVSNEASFTSPLIDATVADPPFLPDVDLPEGPIYWRVASGDEAGNESAFSPSDEFQIDLTAPMAITGLSASRNGNEVILTWDPLAGSTADFANFNIYRSTDEFTSVSGMTPLDSSLTNSTATTFTDTTADGLTIYFYAVTGVDTAGNENTSVISVESHPEIDLSVAVTESSDPTYAGGENLIYEVIVTNTSTLNASGVQVSAELSLVAGVSVETIMTSQGSYSEPTWDLGALSGGSSETLTLELEVDASTPTGSIIGIAASIIAVNEPLTNTGNDSASEETTVEPIPVSAITLAASADPTGIEEPGGPIDFMLQITNTGNTDVEITSLTDDLLGNLDGEGTCSLPQTIGEGSTYECAFAASVNGNAGSSVMDAISASGSGSAGPVSDTDIATVAINDVLPSIALLKTASPTALDEPGGEVSFSVRVDSNTSAESVTLTSLVDDIHGDLNGQGDCSVPQTIPPSGLYACSFTVSISGTGGDVETDTITATASDDESNTTNASDSATVTFNDVLPSFAVTKSASPTVLDEPGGEVSFSVRVDNTGPAESVTLTSLVDDIHGDLNGQGDCAVPQTIPVAGFYACSFAVTISGTAGDSETDTITATVIDDEANAVAAADSATVTIVSRDRIGAYRPSGRLFLKDVDGSGTWNPPADTASTFGVTGDVPLIGDWNGDGDDEIGVYRPASRSFLLDMDGSGTWNPPADITYVFGVSGDIPLVGDWNGDGDDDIGAYRPASRVFLLDLDESGTWTPATDQAYLMGLVGDMPLIGDWNGDGDDDIGIYRPSNRVFLLDYDEGGTWTPATDLGFLMGLIGDRPLAGDWNGDGDDEIGVYRPSIRVYLLDADEGGTWTPATDLGYSFGVNGDLPLSGDWPTTP